MQHLVGFLQSQETLHAFSLPTCQTNGLKVQVTSSNQVLIFYSLIIKKYLRSFPKSTFVPILIPCATVGGFGTYIKHKTWRRSEGGMRENIDDHGTPISPTPHPPTNSYEKLKSSSVPHLHQSTNFAVQQKKKGEETKFHFSFFFSFVIF